MIQVSNSEDELDRSSGVRPSGLIVARIASTLEEEEEEMLLERKKGLHELLAGRAKGLAPKDASTSQLSYTLPSPPSPAVNPFAPTNLKRRKKEKEVAEEGELVPHDEGVPPKQPKTAKGKGRAFLVESKEAKHVAEVHHPTWNPRLQLDGVAIP